MVIRTAKEKEKKDLKQHPYLETQQCNLKGFYSKVRLRSSGWLRLSCSPALTPPTGQRAPNHGGLLLLLEASRLLQSIELKQQRTQASCAKVNL